MTAITFDTLRFVRTLEDAGVDKKQAEAISRAFKDAQGEAELATKRDVRETDLKIDAMRKEMNANFTSIRWFLLIIAMIGVSPYVKMLLD